MASSPRLFLSAGGDGGSWRDWAQRLAGCADEGIMISAARARTSSQLAKKILAAARSADVAELERQLTAAEGLAASPASCSPFLSEQIELLGEVAKQLHAWLRRFSRGLEPGLEPIQAHLLLLDHLAGLPHLAQGAC